VNRVDIEGVSVSPDHFINNERVSSERTFEDRSPLDWTWKLADVARGGAREATLALVAAENAFPQWASLSTHQRGEYLHRLADLIDEHVADIAHVETRDMAMLEESLRLRVISRGARNFRAYADLAEDYEPRRWSSNGTRNVVLRQPAGPTVVITPWNAPFMLSTWKCAPALAAGNTVVLKPAEWSPLSCSLLMDLVAEAGFPPGVFNLVQGMGE
jgi:betaine-aldehyde dehydrogenase/5-carboxymethyl-2-hydroxymuconic-semialdehyde dehydrogenase